MLRVASLTLPFLSIERLRRLERPARRPEPLPLPSHTLDPIDDDPGPCSVPRGGGWRPGARWARDGALRAEGPPQARINALPAHQRPPLREMGRRSEQADHPFRALPADDGVAASAASAPSTIASHAPHGRMTWTSLWGRPMVLIARTGQKEVITAACPQAMALGLHPGMAAAQARALVADLELRDAEPEADQAWLDRLALHAVGHWTPGAAVAGSDGLWLDLTGSSHLFGGEERFCRRLLRFLARLGFSARIAIAGTPGAAHALARYSGEDLTIIEPRREADAIAHLPVAALRLAPAAIEAAARFGLERVGDLYGIARGPLARRLGLAAVQRLDQARGIMAEPIIPVVPFEIPRAERRLLEPIGTAEAITRVIGDLVDDLVSELQTRRLGLRAAMLNCRVVDGREQRIGIGTARASRDGKHLKRMLAMRVERIDPGLGIEAMTLSAYRVEALQPEAMRAALGTGDRAPDLAPLVDQLTGRIEPRGLFRISLKESDVPERATCRLEPLANPTGWPSWKRPVRLLPRPEPLDRVVALLPDHPPRRFIWRGTTYQVISGEGPERVHGEWWRNAREMWAVRDYFMVEAHTGERFWLFRRGDGVEAETGDLSWYLHGLFG